jgi:creatinine amidohydrolase/Fe(II)-dependent formamide hydrolase-like protein
MDYPGFALPSLYIEESAFALIVREVVRGLKRQQFKVIALVNGHGALNHRTTLMRVATETTEPGRATVLLAGYLYDGRYREHAAIGETSYLLAYHPEAVNLAALPPLPEPLGYRDFGILDRQTVVGEPSPGFAVAAEHDPRRATAERGCEDVAYESDQIARRVTEALAALDGA